MRKHCFFLLLIVAFSIRLFVFSQFEGKKHVDTLDYLELSQRIAALDLSGHDGARTPVYPLLMLALSNNKQSIYIFQSFFLGIFSTILLYFLASKTTENNWAGFLVACVFTSAISLLSLEIYAMTESLCVFWIILLAYLFALFDRTASLSLSIFLALVTALAVLTKPLLIVFFPVLLLFIYLSPTKNVFSYLMAYAIPVVILLSVWCAINKKVTGYWTITTLAGYNLTNHVGAFIESAPQEYSLIKKEYIREREKNVALTGSHSMTIFYVQERLSSLTGLSFEDLSLVLLKMSIITIIRQPRLYLQSVFKSWLKFWRPPGPTTYVVLARGKLWPVFVFQAMVHVVISIIFLSTFALFLARRFTLPLELYFSGTLVLFASVFQALLEYGDNARYGLPFSPLIVYFIVSAPFVLMGEFDPKKIKTDRFLQLNDGSQ